MIRRFDHVTIVVRDLGEAKRFFGLLGFKEAVSVVIKGEPFSSYMGIEDIEADHVTLVAEDVEPRTEVQLLRYYRPEALFDGDPRDLHRIGFNHVCFAVDDLDAALKKMTDGGFVARSKTLNFHSRKLVFLDGPEGVTVELSQWG